MTKGNSISYGTPYGNFIRGNKDKLMITYRREPSHDYTMYLACGVLFEGEMHFFGGYNYYDGNDFTRQHFVIETRRSGQLVKMTKKEDLEIGFKNPSCSSLEITSEYFPWFRTNVVIICFDEYQTRSCYSFNGKLKYICDSKFGHYAVLSGLTKYRGNHLTVGGPFTQKTEILKMDENKKYSWSVVEPDFKFTRGKNIESHSLVTVEPSDINNEYVLLIGGLNGGLNRESKTLKKVFKFNGTWFSFGKLNKRRGSHNSIYWNGAVYVIGGEYDADDNKTKIEIWNIKDSQDKFITTENWPELFSWFYPHLFIVPDSFFPDY